MKIYYDENMPYAEAFFSQLGQTYPFSGRTVSAEQIADADVLLVRSITKVNAELLAKNNKLSFVGTATIGVDHVDQAFLKARQIAFHSAPGCNAVSVADYVLSALIVMAEKRQQSLTQLSVAIVGAGNTGTALARKLAALNISYRFVDPFLAAKDPRQFISLDEALTFDVVSLHVPLTRTGAHPTFHMLGQNELSQLTEQQILVNACRGEVIDNKAVLSLKQAGAQFGLVLDVWENEPNIEHALISYTDIATAHIAGYSLEGKARGTEMLYHALCRQLQQDVKTQLANLLPPFTIESIKLSQISSLTDIKKLVQTVYDIRRDDYLFRHFIANSGFDAIRKSYPERRELSALSLTGNLTNSVANLEQLGFNINN